MKKHKNFLIPTILIAVSIYSMSMYYVGYSKASSEKEEVVVQLIEEHSKDIQRLRLENNKTILILKERVEELKKKIDKQQEQLDRIESKADSLQKRLNKLNKNISRLSSIVREESGDKVSEAFVDEVVEYVLEINYEYALEYGFEFDPCLTLAFLKVESNFNSHANSYADAKGIMQLMDKTGRANANELNISTYDPYNWKQNIRIGWYYFSKNRDELGKYKAIVAYNQGYKNLSQAVQESWGDRKSYLNSILSAEAKFKK